MPLHDDCNNDADDDDDDGTMRMPSNDGLLGNERTVDGEPAMVNDGVRFICGLFIILLVAEDSGVPSLLPLLFVTHVLDVSVAVLVDVVPDDDDEPTTPSVPLLVLLSSSLL